MNKKFVYIKHGNLIFCTNFLSLLFFLKGFFYFNVYVHYGRINALIDFSILFFYFFNRYKHRILNFNRTRFTVLMIFLSLLLAHTAFTGLIESVRWGHIPNLFYRHHMIRGAYAVKVQHLIYGSLMEIIKRIIIICYNVFKSYVLVEIFHEDKNYNLLRMFTWGTMFAMPFIFISLSGKNLFQGIRLSPEILPGTHMHPNTVGILFLFILFTNLIILFKEKSKILKFLHILCIIVALCFILLSGARSCLLSIIVSFVFLFSTVWRKHLVTLIVIILSFVVMLYIVLTFLISSGLIKENPLISRLSMQTAIDDRGSGRLDSWYDYYRYTSVKQLFIGVGELATTSTIIYDKFPQRNWKDFIDHPSSTYIYVLLTFGMGGFVCFIVFIFKIFFRIRRKIINNKDLVDYVNMATFISICVWGLTSYASLVGGNIVAIFWIYSISKAVK